MKFARVLVCFLPLIISCGAESEPGLSGSASSALVAAPTEHSSSLKVLLQAIPKGAEKNYGFASRSEMASSQLGPEYPVYTIPPFDRGMSPSVRFTGTWRVALRSGNEFRALTTVVEKANERETVNVGGAGLARELWSLEQSLPEKDSPKGLLRIFQLHADFLFEKPMETSNIYPLRSAQLSLGIGPSPFSFEELSKLIEPRFAAWKEGGAR